MRPLAYLVGMTLKNQLKSMVQKPSRIIYLVFLLALLVFTMTVGNTSGGYLGVHNVDSLIAIVFAFYTAMFIMTARAGFSRGGNLFTLQDATLLFTAPIRPQTILFYGLLRQMTMSLIVGFFLLFQYANLRNAYGITVGHMVGLLVGYGCAIFMGQVCAMMLYAFTSNNQRRKKACQILFHGIYALCAAYIGLRCLSGTMDTAMARAMETVNSGFLYAVPVSGWATLAARGILGGGWGLVLQGLGLCGLLLAALLVLLFRMDADYYEDVLKSAEISYSAISAKKEGTMQEAVPTNIKLGKTGLRGGWGASAFFRKHLLENRRSRKFILPANGLLFAVILVIFCLFVRDGGLVPVFALATYLQLFSALLTGRFNYELTRPYLYLVPEPPLKKLLWALAETLPSTVLDALVVFLPVGVILGLSPVEILAAVAARVSFAIAYLAADIAVERIWGSSASRVLIMLMYLAIAVAIMLPGVVLASVAGVGWGFSAAGMLLLMAAGNLPMSLLVFFLCRNLLECAELSNQ